MPTFNNGHLIERALLSVKKQSYDNWELIIVDNFSSDNTEVICNSHCSEKIKYYKYFNDGIIAKSRNYGIKHSKGDWIAFLDSDDWWLDSKIEKCAYYFNANDLIFHSLELAPSKGLFSKVLKANKIETFLDLLRKGNLIPNSGAIVRKTLLIEVGFINEDIEYLGWEDYDLWLRCLSKSLSVLNISEVLGYYWVGGNTSNNKLVKCGLQSIKKRYLDHVGVGMPDWWVLGIIRSSDNHMDKLKFLYENFKSISNTAKIKILFLIFK